MKHPHFGYTKTGRAVHRDTMDHHPSERWYDRMNKSVAIFTTKIVGTMWCAYAFGLFDCLALPTALHQGTYGIVQWVASFFLQLVLLSVIMVGQTLQSAAADVRAEKQFGDTETIVDRLDLKTQGGLADIEAHMGRQDLAIAALKAQLEGGGGNAGDPDSAGHRQGSSEFAGDCS